MLDDRLISKPLPEQSAWLPPIVESATPMVDACLDAAVPEARRFLGAAVVLASAQVVQKLSTTQPAPDVLLKLVESLRYLVDLSRQAQSEKDVDDPMMRNTLRDAVREIYGLEEYADQTPL